jgi:hypothetical protein
MLHAAGALHTRSLLETSPSRGADEVQFNQPALLRKYFSPAGNVILSEFTTMMEGSRNLKVEICDPKATLFARRTLAVAEERVNVRSLGIAEGKEDAGSRAGVPPGRRCWDVSSGKSGHHVVHMLHERVCISGLPRFVMQGPVCSSDAHEKHTGQENIVYELHPGRLSEFSRGNEYRVLDDECGSSDAITWRATTGLNASVQPKDESLMWTLVRRNGACGRTRAVALINAVESRVECSEGTGMGNAVSDDLCFVVALTSAMALSLESDEHEQKVMDVALRDVNAHRALLAARVGHKRFCDDNGWRVVESIQ